MSRQTKVVGSSVAVALFLWQDIPLGEQFAHPLPLLSCPGRKNDPVDAQIYFRSRSCRKKYIVRNMKRKRHSKADGTKWGWLAESKTRYLKSKGVVTHSSKGSLGTPSTLCFMHFTEEIMTSIYAYRQSCLEPHVWCT